MNSTMNVDWIKGAPIMEDDYWIARNDGTVELCRDYTQFNEDVIAYAHIENPEFPVFEENAK